MNNTKITLSKEGPKISRIVAGTMKWGQWGAQFSKAQYQEMIEACLQGGISTFDHADIYGHFTTEAEFGAVLKGQSSLRQNMELVTKCGICLPSDNRPAFDIKYYDYSQNYILQSVEQSLKNLHTDYIDLLLFHRPSPLMDIKEMAEAMEKLKQSGKVRYFGVSNFLPHQFELLRSISPLVTNQVEASLMHRRPYLDGTFDQAQQHGFAPMIWSPLGGGALFTAEGKAQNQAILEVAHTLMEKYELALDELLLVWLMQHPSKPVPVLGTSKAERMVKALKVIHHQLSTEDWFKLWTAATGEEVP
ncbi:aldo/keto reductase [Persicobacter diffluens]|uniref:Oxidoreductase YcsN n=1 Tax=Persicobacter diffluens TaxID=981 RepID=A0AAN5AMD3_9BACT|nr:putative oxidoreductase YcsN [Persicobacter diffluens]